MNITWVSIRNKRILGLVLRPTWNTHVSPFLVPIFKKKWLYALYLSLNEQSETCIFSLKLGLLSSVCLLLGYREIAICLFLAIFALWIREKGGFSSYLHVWIPLNVYNAIDSYIFWFKLEVTELCRTTRSSGAASVSGPFGPPEFENSGGFDPFVKSEYPWLRQMQWKLANSS